MPNMLDKITQAWAEAWGQGDTAAFERLTAPAYRRRSKTGDEDLAEVLRQIVESHQAFSDLEMDVLCAIEDDNLVAIHWSSTGRHTGDFMGVPATDRTVTVNGASFIRHCDGQITHESVVWDPREMLSAISIFHLGDPWMKNVLAET